MRVDTRLPSYKDTFLYGQVLHKEIGPVDQIERAKRSKRLPEVFTPKEARKVIAQLQGTNHLMASLLYGDRRQFEIPSQISSHKYERPSMWAALSSLATSEGLGNVSGDLLYVRPRPA